MEKCHCELGSVVKNRLNSLDKSQNWLAVQCNVTRGQISHVVTGRCRSSIKLIFALSNILEINLDTIFKAISQE